MCWLVGKKEVGFANLVGCRSLSVVPWLFLSSGPACDHHAVVGTGVEKANLWHDVDHLRVGESGGEGEGLQEPGQEEEELVLGELLTKAISLSHKKWNATVVLLEVSLDVKEAVGVEVLRLVPVFRVVHDV